MSSYDYLGDAGVVVSVLKNNVVGYGKNQVQAAKNAIDLLKIKCIGFHKNVFSNLLSKIDGWPSVGSANKLDVWGVYEHFSEYVDEFGSEISIIMPYEHVVDSVDISAELEFIAAGIVLLGGPTFGFIGFLPKKYEWHDNKKDCIVIVHTGTPPRNPEEFVDLICYDFASREDAWRFLSTGGKKYRESILHYDEVLVKTSARSSWDAWWVRICDRRKHKYPWYMLPNMRHTIFDEASVDNE